MAAAAMQRKVGLSRPWCPLSRVSNMLSPLQRNRVQSFAGTPERTKWDVHSASVRLSERVLAEISHSGRHGSKTATPFRIDVEAALTTCIDAGCFVEAHAIVSALGKSGVEPSPAVQADFLTAAAGLHGAHGAGKAAETMLALLPAGEIDTWAGSVQGVLEAQTVRAVDAVARGGSGGPMSDARIATVAAVAASRGVANACLLTALARSGRAQRLRGPQGTLAAELLRRVETLQQGQAASPATSHGRLNVAPVLREVVREWAAAEPGQGQMDPSHVTSRGGGSHLTAPSHAMITEAIAAGRIDSAARAWLSASTSALGGRGIALTSGQQLATALVNAAAESVAEPALGSTLSHSDALAASATKPRQNRFQYNQSSSSSSAAAAAAARGGGGGMSLDVQSSQVSPSYSNAARHVASADNHDKGSLTAAASMASLIAGPSAAELIIGLGAADHEAIPQKQQPAPAIDSSTSSGVARAGGGDPALLALAVLAELVSMGATPRAVEAATLQRVLARRALYPQAVQLAQLRGETLLHEFDAANSASSSQAGDKTKTKPTRRHHEGEIASPGWVSGAVALHAACQTRHPWMPELAAQLRALSPPPTAVQLISGESWVTLIGQLAALRRWREVQSTVALLRAAATTLSRSAPEAHDFAQNWTPDTHQCDLIDLLSDPAVVSASTTAASALNSWPHAVDALVAAVPGVRLKRLRSSGQRLPRADRSAVNAALSAVLALGTPPRVFQRAVAELSNAGFHLTQPAHVRHLLASLDEQNSPEHCALALRTACALPTLVVEELATLVDAGQGGIVANYLATHANDAPPRQAQRLALSLLKAGMTRTAQAGPECLQPAKASQQVRIAASGAVLVSLAKKLLGDALAPSALLSLAGRDEFDAAQTEQQSMEAALAGGVMAAALTTVLATPLREVDAEYALSQAAGQPSSSLMELLHQQNATTPAALHTDSRTELVSLPANNQGKFRQASSGVRASSGAWSLRMQSWWEQHNRTESQRGPPTVAQVPQRAAEFTEPSASQARGTTDADAHAVLANSWFDAELAKVTTSRV